MPRTQRLKISDKTAVYHVMSRAALDGFPLGDIEKDFMLDLIRRYAALYLFKILGFCLMGNHHLLVKMFPEYKFSDEDIKKRHVGFYRDDRAFACGQVPSLREKLSNLSEFVREIKVDLGVKSTFDSCLKIPKVKRRLDPKNKWRKKNDEKKFDGVGY